ncbi:MAG TPA: L-threonylcarbamoyladenylate synthase [Gaiellaceae bacterium]|nr:L-threonylcarbamoyladenylate synthase [Gaiellaceae bacterium]
MTDAAAALAAGEVVILPTDTVYGLCAAATEEGTERLYAVKGRAARQPTALVAATVDQLLAAVPELDGALVRSLLPGPFTLVVPNPACRYAWLTGERPDAIGVRVPEWPASAARAVATAGPVVATSANLPGGRDPRRVEDIPTELRDRVAAIVDAGELPGTPSTVVDLTADEPRIIREGAVPSSDVLARLARR